MPVEELLRYRELLNGIDSELVPLLEKRLTVSRQIGLLKQKTAQPIYDPKREEEILERNHRMLSDQTLALYLDEIYREIMAESRRLQGAIAGA